MKLTMIQTIALSRAAWLIDDMPKDPLDVSEDAMFPESGSFKPLLAACFACNGNKDRKECKLAVNFSFFSCHGVSVMA